MRPFVTRLRRLAALGAATALAAGLAAVGAAPASQAVPPLITFGFTNPQPGAFEVTETVSGETIAVTQVGTGLIFGAMTNGGYGSMVLMSTPSSGGGLRIAIPGRTFDFHGLTFIGGSFPESIDFTSDKGTIVTGLTVGGSLDAPTQITFDPANGAPNAQGVQWVELTATTWNDLLQVDDIVVGNVLGAPTTTTTSTTTTSTTTTSTTTTTPTTSTTTAAPTTTVTTAPASTTTSTVDPAVTTTTTTSMPATTTSEPLSTLPPLGNPVVVVANPTTTTSTTTTIPSDTIAPSGSALPLAVLPGSQLTSLTTTTTTLSPAEKVATANELARRLQAGLDAGLIDPRSVIIEFDGRHLRLRFQAPEGVVDFEIWIFSNPIRLGVAHADANGIVQFDADLPAGISGAHHVVVKSIGADGTVGEAPAASMPIVIPEVAPAALAFTGASTVATALTGVALVLSGLLLTRFRRRRAS